MVTSAARIEANRKNAARSTGPRTPEGKERSRSNAMTHGLRASVLDHPDDVGALPGRVGEAGPAPEMTTSVCFDDWLVHQVGLTASKLDRCQDMEMAARHRVVLRATVTWDEDRRLDAIRLASKLAKRPEEVVAGLRETLQGCDWLISRWALLAYSAGLQGDTWTPEQTRLASDLLGTPEEFRERRPPGVSVDAQGRPTGPSLRPLAVARRALDELAARHEILVPLDQVAQERAEDGLFDDDPEVRRLRRYESELRRRLKWTLEMLGAVSPDVQETEQATEARTGETPEPMLERIRPREVPPARPSPTSSKADRRLQKAESRREAKRRKLEQIRN